MKWLLDLPLTAFDLETTGVEVENAHIVTSCLALLQPAKPTWLRDITSELIAVDIDIPPEATAVHGITTEHARAHGTPATDTISNISKHVAELLAGGFPVVGMNLAYDLTILDRECRRHDLPTVEDHLGSQIAPVVDIYVIDKWVDPYRKGGRKLTDMIQFYGVRHEGAHDSTGDALAAARVAYRMAQVARSAHAEITEFFRSAGRREPQEIADRFKALGDMTPGGLHLRQQGWRAEQQASLREYLMRLRKPGEPEPRCDPRWPVQTFEPLL